MFKTVVIPHNKDYLLTLPNEYLNRPIEILVFPVDSSKNDQESPQPLRLTALERERPYSSHQTPSAEQEQIANAVAAVRETWASIPLDKKTAIYIAEDKELEYDI